MESRNKNTGNKVYRKVLFVFFASCIALGLAYTISKFTFDNMLHTVDNIAKPNDKLRLVTQITRDILQLDQNQRSEFLLSTTLPSSEDQSYLIQSENIVLRLDSLKKLYADDSLQQTRIDSISNLLKERDKLFIAYIQVRKSLINNAVFTTQIQNINKIIETSPKSTKTITTSSTKTNKNVTESKQKEIKNETEEKKSDNRSFFARLFGINKKEETKNEVIEEEDILPINEVSVVTDTVHNESNAKINDEINTVIQDLKQTRQLQSASFIDHENDLIIAGNILINGMVEILDEVEREVNFQVTLDTKNAQEVVNQNVSKIQAILITTILITGFLILLILNDIRRANLYRLELEKAKEEAEYHSAAKQRFLSNMSHELRTPLQSIIGYTEQLSTSKADKNISVIHHASEHLLQIVNELLDYNRIISGKFILNNDVIYVSKLLNEVTDTMMQLAEKKDIKLYVIDNFAGNDLVLGDSFRIKQILYNLISNAIKFTEKGEVKIEAKAIPINEITEIEFLISDTGIGISEQDLTHIFSEFEQGKTHQSGNHFGSGLGLSIVKSLIEEMNGTISVTSVENEGSQFKVNLSLPTSEDEPLAINNINNSFKNENVKEVWIVDDDAFILELCSIILKKNEIEYKTFSSPTALLNEPITDSLSHILMDLRMPIMPGNELRKVMVERITNDVKIIAFTAQALPHERAEIIEEGFDALLMKPFKEIELLTLLGKADKQAKNTHDLTNANLASLEENSKEKAAIIKLFISDTFSDLKDLKSAIKQTHATDAENLLHRLAGRTAQLGQDKIAFQLRKCEIDTRNGELTPLKEVIKIEGQLVAFIEELSNNEITDLKFN